MSGPARLLGLDVSEIKDAMVAEARNEPGALPLVENALHWLWEKRANNNRLSGHLFTDQGGLAGILSRSADGLLSNLDAHQRDLPLQLLLQLVRVDPDGFRNVRRRMSFTEAVALAGGGALGRALVSRLAGHQWSYERVREAAALRQVGPEVVLSEDEREFLGPADAEAMLGARGQAPSLVKPTLA
jgi:hypothetical protein